MNQHHGTAARLGVSPQISRSGAVSARPHPLGLLCIIFTFPRLEMCFMRCALCVNASSFVTREASEARSVHACPMWRVSH